MLRTFTVLLLSSLLLPVLGTRAIRCQTPVPVQLKQSNVPPSLPVLYRQFLAYQLHLDRKADELKKAGKNGEDFRTHYQTVLGFSDSEFAHVRSSALHLETMINAKDAEAQAIIVAARAASPKTLTKGVPLPPPPAQLATLQQERDSLIGSEVDTLYQKLTPAHVQKLETFLRRDFAPAVTLNSVVPLHISQPSLLKAGAHQ